MEQPGRTQNVLVESAVAPEILSSGKEEIVFSLYNFKRHAELHGNLLWLHYVCYCREVHDVQMNARRRGFLNNTFFDKTWHSARRAMLMCISSAYYRRKFHF